MTKLKLIMDVDPGIDDSLAILFAAKHSSIELLGLTIASGNIEVNQGARNAYKALSMVNRTDVPIHKGSLLPLKRNYVDATDTHGKDGIGEIYFPDIDPKEQESAIDFIIKSCYRYPNEITIAALGPLSNLAMVIQKDPHALQLAKEIVIMGGAAKTHGNCSEVAEYNFWCDPDAADIFFEAKLKNVTLVPLDVTYKILLSPNKRDMIRQFNTPLSTYVYDITQFYVNFHWNQERTLGCIINDPLVIAYLVSHHILKFEKGSVDIVTEGKALGESIVDFRMLSDRPPVNIALNVDSKAFFHLFLTTIFDDFKDDIELMFRKEMLG